MAAEVSADLTLIQDEDVLRRMWADTEDFGRKKEIRARMYKLREQRLRDFYTTGEVVSEITGRKHASTTHTESIGDQGFLTMKSKEIRDSESPTRDLNRRGENNYWTTSKESSYTTGNDGGALVETRTTSEALHGSRVDGNTQSQIAMEAQNIHEASSKSDDNMSCKSETQSQTSRMVSSTRTQDDTGNSMARSTHQQQSSSQHKSEQQTSSTSHSSTTKWSSSTSSSAAKRIVSSSSHQITSGDDNTVYNTKAITSGDLVDTRSTYDSKIPVTQTIDSRNVSRDYETNETLQNKYTSHDTQNTSSVQYSKYDSADYNTVRTFVDNERLDAVKNDQISYLNRNDINRTDNREYTTRVQTKDYENRNVQNITSDERSYDTHHRDYPIQREQTDQTVDTTRHIYDNDGYDVQKTTVTVDRRTTTHSDDRDIQKKTTDTRTTDSDTTNIVTEQKIMSEIQKLDSYLSAQNTPGASTPVSPHSVSDASSWTIVSNTDGEFVYQADKTPDNRVPPTPDNSARATPVKHPSTLELPKETTEGQYVTTYQHSFTRISVDNSPTHEYFVKTLRASPDRSTPPPTKRTSSKGSLDRSSPERKFRGSPSRKTPDKERRVSVGSYTIEKTQDSKRKTSDTTRYTTVTNKETTKSKRKLSSTQAKTANKTRVATPGASPSTSPTRSNRARPNTSSDSDSDGSQIHKTTESAKKTTDDIMRKDVKVSKVITDTKTDEKYGTYDKRKKTTETSDSTKIIKTDAKSTPNKKPELRDRSPEYSSEGSVSRELKSLRPTATYPDSSPERSAFQPIKTTQVTTQRDQSAIMIHEEQKHVAHTNLIDVRDTTDTVDNSTTQEKLTILDKKVSSSPRDGPITDGETIPKTFDRPEGASPQDQTTVKPQSVYRPEDHDSEIIPLDKKQPLLTSRLSPEKETQKKTPLSESPVKDVHDDSIRRSPERTVKKDSTLRGSPERTSKKSPSPSKVSPERAPKKDEPAKSPERVTKKSSPSPRPSPDRVAKKSSPSPRPSPERVAKKSSSSPQRSPERSTKKSSPSPQRSPERPAIKSSTSPQHRPERVTNKSSPSPQRSPDRTVKKSSPSPQRSPDRATKKSSPSPQRSPERITKKSLPSPQRSPERITKKSSPSPQRSPDRTTKKSSPSTQRSPDRATKKMSPSPQRSPDRTPKETSSSPQRSPDRTTKKAPTSLKYSPDIKPKKSSPSPTRSPERTTKKTTTLLAKSPDSVPKKSLPSTVQSPERSPKKPSTSILKSPDSPTKKHLPSPSQSPERTPKKSSPAVSEETIRQMTHVVTSLDRETKKSSISPSPENVPESIEHVPIVDLSPEKVVGERSPSSSPERVLHRQEPVVEDDSQHETSPYSSPERTPIKKEQPTLTSPESPRNKGIKRESPKSSPESPLKKKDTSSPSTERVIKKPLPSISPDRIPQKKTPYQTKPESKERPLKTKPLDQIVDTTNRQRRLPEIPRSTTFKTNEKITQQKITTDHKVITRPTRMSSIPRSENRPTQKSPKENIQPKSFTKIASPKDRQPSDKRPQPRYSSPQTRTDVVTRSVTTVTSSRTVEKPKQTPVRKPTPAITKTSPQTKKADDVYGRSRIPIERKPKTPESARRVTGTRTPSKSDDVPQKPKTPTSARKTEKTKTTKYIEETDEYDYSSPTEDEPMETIDIIVETEDTVDRSTVLRNVKSTNVSSIVNKSVVSKSEFIENEKYTLENETIEDENPPDEFYADVDDEPTLPSKKEPVRSSDDISTVNKTTRNVVHDIHTVRKIAQKQEADLLRTKSKPSQITSPTKPQSKPIGTKIPTQPKESKPKGPSHVPTKTSPEKKPNTFEKRPQRSDQSPKTTSKKTPKVVKDSSSSSSSEDEDETMIIKQDVETSLNERRYIEEIEVTVKGDEEEGVKEAIVTQDKLTVVVQHPKSSRESSPDYPSRSIPFSATSDDGESIPRYADYVSEPEDVEIFDYSRLGPRKPVPCSDHKPDKPDKITDLDDEMDAQIKLDVSVADRVCKFMETTRKNTETVTQDHTPISAASPASVRKAKAMFENIAKNQASPSVPSKKKIDIYESPQEPERKQSIPKTQVELVTMEQEEDIAVTEEIDLSVHRKVEVFETETDEITRVAQRTIKDTEIDYMRRPTAPEEIEDQSDQLSDEEPVERPSATKGKPYRDAAPRGKSPSPQRETTPTTPVSKRAPEDSQPKPGDGLPKKTLERNQSGIASGDISSKKAFFERKVKEAEKPKDKPITKKDLPQTKTSVQPKQKVHPTEKYSVTKEEVRKTSGTVKDTKVFLQREIIETNARVSQTIDDEVTEFVKTKSSDRPKGHRESPSREKETTSPRYSPERSPVRKTNAEPSPERIHPRKESVERGSPERTYPRKESVERRSPERSYPRKESAQRPSPERTQPRKESVDKKSPERVYPRKESTERKSPERSYHRKESTELKSPERSYPRKESVERKSPERSYPRKESIDRKSPERSYSRKESVEKKSPERTHPRREPGDQKSPERSPLKTKDVNIVKKDESPDTNKAGGKFGVTLRRTPSSSNQVPVPAPSVRRPSAPGDHPEIEDIFQLELLEEMLLKAVAYDERRRIRAQIRVVKRQLEETLNSQTTTHRTTKTVTSSTKQPQKPYEASPSRKEPTPTRKVTSESVQRHVETVVSETAQPLRTYEVCEVVRREDGEATERRTSQRTIESVRSIRKSSPEKQQPSSPLKSRESPERKQKPADTRSTKTPTRKTQESPERKQPKVTSDRSSPERKTSAKAETTRTVVETVKTYRRSSQDKSPERRRPTSPTSRDIESVNSFRSRTSPEKSPARRTSTEIDDYRQTESKTAYETVTTVRSQTTRKTSSNEVKETCPTDSITSSYGVGPTDENGRPLFGLKALRRTNTNKTLTDETEKIVKEEKITTSDEEREICDVNGRPLFGLKALQTTEDTMPAQPSTQLKELVEKHQQFVLRESSTTESQPRQKPKARLRDSFVSQSQDEDILNSVSSSANDSVSNRGLSLRSIIQKHEDISNPSTSVKHEMKSSSTSTVVKSVMSSDGKISVTKETVKGEISSNNGEEPSGKITRSHYSYKSPDEKQTTPSVTSTTTTSIIGQRRRSSGPKIFEIEDSDTLDDKSSRRYSKEYIVDEGNDSSVKEVTKKRESFAVNETESSVSSAQKFIQNFVDDWKKTDKFSSTSVRQHVSPKVTEVSDTDSVNKASSEKIKIVKKFINEESTSDQSALKKKTVKDEDEKVASGKKTIIRGDSVRALQHKFQQATEAANQPRSRAYPPAGLILRSNSLQPNDDEEETISSTSKQLSEKTDSKSRIQETRTRETKSASPVITTKVTTHQDSRTVTTVSKTPSDEVSEGTVKTVKTSSQSGTSFLDNTTKVTGVQDVLTRMRNANLVVESDDTAEDAEARALLNKFLGASVILQGMEQGMRAQEAAGSPSSATLVSQAEKQRVMATTTRTQEDIDEITDEKQLRILLEACSDYEGRRRIRARLRAIMADQKATGDEATLTGSDGGGSERQEFVETKQVETKTDGDNITRTEVTTRTSSSTARLTKANSVQSPFAKFRQLERQNSAPSVGRGAPMFKFTDPKLVRSASTIKERLLNWVQAQTREYKNIQINNFSTSWSNGLAFCALIHHFYPDAFDYDSLTPEKRRYNFELAFRTADEKAGIAPLLDVEDMVTMRKPDWKCVFTYVQSFYRRLHDTPEAVRY